MDVSRETGRLASRVIVRMVWLQGGCIIAAVRSGWQKARPIAVFADRVCTAQPAACRTLGKGLR